MNKTTTRQARVRAAMVVCPARRVGGRGLRDMTSRLDKVSAVAAKRCAQGIGHSKRSRREPLEISGCGRRIERPPPHGPTVLKEAA